MITFRPPSPRLKKWLKRLGIALLTGVLALFIFYLSVLWGAFGPMPGKDGIRSIRNHLASEIYSADGELMGKYFVENRTGARFDELPEILIDALIATEDVRFFEHDGVDRRSLLRVVFKSILMGRKSSGGGSTITQQLVKNLYGRRDYGILSMPVAKMRESILAKRMEEVLDKGQILELYLNTVGFGESVYGIETAAQRYFNKLPAELTIEECAVLVGLLKANTLYNPRRNPEIALQRRNTVVSQMAKYDFITAKQSDSIRELPLTINYYNIETESPAPYFIAHIRSEAEDILREVKKPDGSDYDLETDGLRVETTIDSRLQEAATQAVLKHMKNLHREFAEHWPNGKPWGRHSEVLEAQILTSAVYQREKDRGLDHDSIVAKMSVPHNVEVVDLQSKDGMSVMELSSIDSIAYYQSMLHTGFVAMDPRNGTVKAWVGGLNHQYLPYDHVTTRRQTASTFKPFVYGAALEFGIEPCKYYRNIHQTYPDFDNWTPTNSNGDDSLYYNMRGALKNSLNVISVKLMFDAGRKNVKAFAEKMGIESPVKPVPSMALGTNEATLFEMVKAYGVFANGGNPVNPVFITRITDAFGVVLYNQAETTEEDGAIERILDTAVARQMDDMLRAVVNEGTAVSARTVYGLQGDYAGKTGTTQNYSDGWFIGYSPKFVAGAWVGASNPKVHFRSGRFGSGAHMALPIWAGFFKSIESQSGLKEFRADPDYETKAIESPCPDVREATFLERLGSWFESGVKEVDTANEGRKSFWDRLFN